MVLRRDTRGRRPAPGAKLARECAGCASLLLHVGGVRVETRDGLPVSGRVTEAVTDAECDAGIEMLRGVTQGRRATVAADAGYDRERFVREARAMGVVPHVTQLTKTPSHIDARTTRHAGYAISLKKSKGIEPIFGWLKNTGLLRRVRHRGRALVQWTFTLALSAYTLIRMRTISLQTA